MNHSTTAADHRASVNVLIRLPLKLQSLQQSSPSFQLFGLTSERDAHTLPTCVPDPSTSSTHHPHDAFTAKVVKNCPQHNSVKHFLLWSADSARCCAGKCGCAVAGAPWNPSKIPAAFQTSSDTQDQCLATCLWHSSTAWALWRPNLQLLAP